MDEREPALTTPSIISIQQLIGRYRQRRICKHPWPHACHSQRPTTRRSLRRLPDSQEICLDREEQATATVIRPETRALVAEVQQDRHSAQEVIDIMRDKLQNMEPQLIESKQRVAGYNILQAVRLADHDSQKRLETSYATKLETASGAARSEVSTVIEEQMSGLEHLLQERNALIATLEATTAT
ncbi:hypothetical protein BDZ89DRAFT_1128626 [Hymenopellis radicata]|nr:hypothetical protein BDZ89DRAFT_1128626 [Hymenopellis radicata]